MAISGQSLAITVGIYLAIAIVVFILFSLWRDNRFTRKFFAPKRHMPGHKPPAIRGKLGQWVPQVLWLSEAEVIRSAGVDAAVYLKILRMGFELFCIISFLVLAIILPINITGTEVDTLMSDPNAGSSQLSQNPLAWWANTPPPPAPPGQEPTEAADGAVIKPPDFYASDLPPAPPGMIWWKYLDSVPPLPDPSQVPELGPAYAKYGWRWDASYQEVKYTFTSLDKTTMSNVAARSPSLWAHLVITYVVTFIAYYWLWKYNKEALRLRIFYLLNQPPGAESHTVLVQDVPGVAYGTIPNRADGTLLKLIPKSVKKKAFAQANMLAARTKSAVSKGAVPGGEAHFAGKDGSGADNADASLDVSTSNMNIDATTGRWEMRDEWATAVKEVIDRDGSVAGMVENEFRKIHGDDMSAVHMCHNTEHLDPLCAEYEKVKMAVTDLVDNYISMKRRGKELKPKKVTVIGMQMGEWGKSKYGMKPVKVEALQFYRDRLTELRRVILEEQDKARAPDSIFPAAFVTFRKRTAQVVAARTLMSEDLSTWRMQAAPRAEEIVWKNLGYRVWERSGRNMAMWVLFWLMAAFFMIPVTAVQGLLTMNSFLEFVNSIPVAGAFITGILPGLALKIFLVIVPIILRIMNKFSGMVSGSQIDLGVVYKFFIFQVITVFIGSFIAGTFANQLDQFISDPGSIITIFGTSAPQTAFFFLTYLLLAALPQASMTLMRAVPLLIFWIKTKFLAGTDRAKARLWQNQTSDYGTLIPDDTIAILLGLTFCIVCPLIAPVAVAYFAHNYLVWKYQLVYTYNPAYQSGGRAWTRVFDQCMTGLVCFHLMMVALLGVKKMVAPSLLCIILWLFDIAFWVAVHKTFYRPQECLSLISAAENDKKDADLAAQGKVAPPGHDVDARYLSPSFKFDEEAHEAALDEAARMGAVLAGGEDEKLFAESAPTEYEPDADEERERGDLELGAGTSRTDEQAPGPAGSSKSVSLEVPPPPPMLYAPYGNNNNNASTGQSLLGPHSGQGQDQPSAQL